jgi:molybdenum cofactor synthesis domain-containing protein
MTTFAAKVLTVSDGVFHGVRDDVSGAVLAQALRDSGAEVVESSLCADGVESVTAELRRLSAGFNGVVITTGGTGFAPRDLTPEATRHVIEREAPGLAEAMRALNPLGRLSRGVVGIVGQCIIVNTPGSPKGCVEQIGAIIDVLPHAVALLGEQPTTH